MDPISAVGLVASIITLLDLAKPLAKQLEPSSHSKQELNRMIRVLIASKRSYKCLRDFLEYNDEQDSALADCLAEPEKQSIEVLSLLRARLENQNFVDRYVMGGKWDKKFDKWIKALENARESFDLAIQVDQYKSSSTVLKTMKNHIDVSTTYFKDITTSVDLNTERLADIAVQTHDQHTEAREWHNEDIEKLEEVADEITTWKDEIQTKQDDILRDEIVRWLCNTDPGMNQEAAVKKHESKTGSWFIDSDQYKNWLQNADFIWLQGMAGCGKTILCSSIIETTRRHCKITSNTALAYFYFSYTDVEKQKVSSFIRSILGQFVHQRARAPEILKDLYDSHKHSTPPIKSLLSVLNTILRLPGENFLIIDALDECPVQENGRDELCEHLRHLSGLNKLHILATSRKEVDLVDGLTGSERLVVTPIRNPEVDADIRRYVESQLETNSRFRAMKWLFNVKDDILDTLESGSQGMFRWAFCQLETIKACRNSKDVRDKLKSLPKTLDETYTRILEAIADDDRQVASTALQWLAFSNRPLTIEELAEAAIINIAQDSAFQEENRFEDPLEILRILSSLVTIQIEHNEGRINEDQLDQTDDGTREPSQHDLIILAHFSIKEYLVSNRLPISVQQFAMKPSIGHKVLTESCLQYTLHVLNMLGQERTSFELTETENLPNPEVDSDTGDTLQNTRLRYIKYTMPLGKYSRIEWARHKDECVLDLKCSRMIYRALSSSSWNTLGDVWDLSFGEVSEPADIFKKCPLYVAVYLDLDDVCSMMLAAGADPNQLVESEYRLLTPLDKAIDNGNERIARQLIDSGCHVKFGGPVSPFDSDLHTTEALHYAVRNDRLDLVQLLINSGANTGSYYTGFYVDPMGFKTVSPLEIAAHHQRWDIFEYISEHGRDVNFEHSLGIAAINGNRKVLEALLKREANSNSMPDVKIRGKYMKILNTLLDFGINVDARGVRAGSALQQVAILDKNLYFTRMEHMKRLFEYGIDPNIHLKDDITCAETQGKTLLQRILLAGPGFWRGKWRIGDLLQEVKLLLDNGANIHPPGEEDWSSLQRILKILPREARDVSLIYLLLEHGAVLDSDPKLSKAAEAKDYLTLARLLLSPYKTSAPYITSLDTDSDDTNSADSNNSDSWDTYSETSS